MSLRCAPQDNPEHGLRLILTFKPTTSFLVPLDRCVTLARQGLGTPGGTDGNPDPYFRCVVVWCGSRRPCSASLHVLILATA